MKRTAFVVFCALAFAVSQVCAGTIEEELIYAKVRDGAGKSLYNLDGFDYEVGKQTLPDGTERRSFYGSIVDSTRAGGALAALDDATLRNVQHKNVMRLNALEEYYLFLLRSMEFSASKRNDIEE